MVIENVQQYSSHGAKQMCVGTKHYGHLIIVASTWVIWLDSAMRPSIFHSLLLSADSEWAWCLSQESEALSRLHAANFHISSDDIVF